MIKFQKKFEDEMLVVPNSSLTNTLMIEEKFNHNEKCLNNLKKIVKNNKFELNDFIERYKETIKNYSKKTQKEELKIVNTLSQIIDIIENEI